MSKNRLQFAPCLAGILCALALCSWNVSTAFATHFMLDVEAGTATPGQAGGKTAVTSGGAVTMSIYALFQGTSSNSANYLPRLVEGWFRSSNGGLLGDLTASANATYSFIGFGGIQNDVDGDGDLDIGGTFDTDSFFLGSTAAQEVSAQYGHQDGTITAAIANTLDSNAPATGNDYAYSLIGTLTFTPITPPTFGQQTTVTMIRNTNATGGNVTAESAQDLGAGAGTGGTIADGRFNWNGTAGPTAAVLQGAGVVITSVPEPATFALATVGALGLAALGIRRRRCQLLRPANSSCR